MSASRRGNLQLVVEAKNYDDDKGLRIDLVFGNAAVVRRFQSARIDRGHYADRGRTRKPDHAPVFVDLA